MGFIPGQISNVLQNYLYLYNFVLGFFQGSFTYTFIKANYIIGRGGGPRRPMRLISNVLLTPVIPAGSTPKWLFTQVQVNADTCVIEVSPHR